MSVEEHFGGGVVHHGADRPDGQPVALGALHVDDEHGQSIGALRDLIRRRGARQQQHQVGMFGAAGPDLLAVDDVIVIAVALREGLQRGGIGAAGRLGDAEGLQPQFAGGDLRQILGLLLLAAVPQQGAHDVHLGMAGGAIAAGALDFLEDRGGGRQRQAGAAIFLGDQRREIAGLGQRRRRIRWDRRVRGRACASIRRETGRRAWRPRRGYRQIRRAVLRSWELGMWFKNRRSVSKKSRSMFRSSRNNARRPRSGGRSQLSHRFPNTLIATRL